MTIKKFLLKVTLISFILLAISYTALFISAGRAPDIHSLDQNPEFEVQSAYDLPDFWNLTEIQKIPLNITIEDTRYVWDETHQKNFTVQNLYYTSQYWINNTPLRIDAALVFPDNSSKQLGLVPAIVVMHGIGGNLLQLFNQLYFLAANNYTAIAISFPGHGNSSGPPPVQEWIIPNLAGYNGTITPDLLNQTHFYLITRAAVRAVDVLLNQSVVDPTRIAMTGGSYGGLTTMFASNVYWQKVRSAIPVIASGNLDISFSTPWSLTNLIVNPNEYDLTQPPVSDLIQYFDPIYYVNTTNNPATLFIAGTNDDFFPVETFNNTFYATNNATKAMSMTPAGHHGFLMDPMEGTVLYWLNHTLFNGPAPPIIDVVRDVESTIFGSKLKITANVTCDVPISKVFLATHWEIMGATWKKTEMTQSSGVWTLEKQHLPFNAEITYFVIVELENGEYITFFSSYVWRDEITTWLEIPFFILIGVGLAMPIYLLMRRDVRKMKSRIEATNQRRYLYLNGIQLAGMGTTEIFIFVSLFLPLVVALPESNSFGISLAVVLNEFIDLFPFFAYVVFTCLITGFILTMSKPVLGGLINLIVPIMLVMIGLSMLPMLGAYEDNTLVSGLSGPLVSVGIGLILWFVMCGVQIGFGIFKRKYQKRL
ncbi:MAG: alpha/beta fold hydrolase [Candidatus Helarchaeota archaeon]|nr:alpha/beta fold hydrolase [Candidatus Helarchaeota archaeon]